MIQVSVKFPDMFTNLLDDEAVSQKCTKSQYAEHLIRNGISIFMLMEHFKHEKNNVGIDVCGSIIRTGIINVKPGYAKHKSDTKILACDPEIRWGELAENKRKMKCKGPTSFYLTDPLVEYLTTVANQIGKSMSIVVFMYMQTSLAGWLLRSSRSDDNQNLEEADKIFDLIKYCYVSMDFDDGVLHVHLQKKDRSDKAKNLANKLKSTLANNQIALTQNQTKHPSYKGALPL